MAGSLNKVILIGNLGRDPEIRTTGEGKEIANFSIATSESWKDRNTGEKKERTEWHRVVIFSEGLVSIVKNYVKKGAKIYIEGSLQTRKWQNNSGVEQYTTEVVLQNFNSQLVLLDSKNSSSSSSDSYHTEAKQSDHKNNSFDHSDLDDEIPF
ncbi:single-stranded DNA-binding protein [Rickettsia endosymbiont of Halotydeus destructor]|uniref:single-stranded DNA-binding protein n=1 Tax=Rickettsia endosymbiont of Halotydeus destructor TaxID=2996754 RepID=UPI003BAFF29A